MPDGTGRVSFIVRLSREATGGVRTVTENVRTGEKERVDGIDAISPVIARMVARASNAFDSEEEKDHEPTANPSKAMGPGNRW